MIRMRLCRNRHPAARPYKPELTQIDFDRNVNAGLLCCPKGTCQVNFFECANGFAQRPVPALNADLTANYTKAVCNEYNAKQWPGGAARQPGHEIHTPWPESESLRCQNRGESAHQQELHASAAPFVSVRP
jgi:hypothetical protein